LLLVDFFCPLTLDQSRFLPALRPIRLLPPPFSSMGLIGQQARRGIRLICPFRRWHVPRDLSWPGLAFVGTFFFNLAAAQKEWLCFCWLVAHLFGSGGFLTLLLESAADCADSTETVRLGRASLSSLIGTTQCLILSSESSGFLYRYRRTRLSKTRAFL